MVCGLLDEKECKASASLNGSFQECYILARDLLPVTSSPGHKKWQTQSKQTENDSSRAPTVTEKIFTYCIVSRARIDWAEKVQSKTWLENITGKTKHHDSDGGGVELVVPKSLV